MVLRDARPPAPAAAARAARSRDRPRGPLAAGGRPVSLRDLAGAPWASGAPPSAHDRLVHRACRVLGGFTPDVRHRSNDLLVLLARIRSGHAVTLLPDLGGAQGDPTLAVRDLAEGPLTRVVFLAVRAAAAEHPALQAVRAALQAAAQDEASTGAAAG